MEAESGHGWLKFSYAVNNAKGEAVVPQGKKITNSVFREMTKQGIAEAEIAPNDVQGAYVAADVIDMSTGEVLIEANHELTETGFHKLMEAGIETVEVFFPERDDAGNVISVTLRKDPVKSPNDALLEIYRKLRPGDPPTLDTATQLFHGMFFDARKYDFSRVGRMKFNIKLHDNADATSLDKRVLDQQDFINTIQYLLKLRRGIGAVDDIDHLGNRRVRAVDIHRLVSTGTADAAPPPGSQVQDHAHPRPRRPRHRRLPRFPRRALVPPKPHRPHHHCRGPPSDRNQPPSSADSPSNIDRFNDRSFANTFSRQDRSSL